MPFIADTRCGVLDIRFNVNIICEELESLLEMEYTEDIREGSIFWIYVNELEYTYTRYLNNATHFQTIWNWFVDNYNNVESWNEIVGNFREHSC